ncbi:MAG: hypothetical protein IPO81_01225 [Kouleothrix sp.]|nr:hypothetical protein [Kouleothrix sp.]
MRRTHRVARRAILVAGAVLLLSCGLVGLFASRTLSTEARAQQLAQAEHRWQTRPFSRYRLVMQAPSWCRMDVEIQDERLAHVFENSCPGSIRTVTDLFQLIQQLDSSADTIYCAPAGCECTEIRAVRVDYDAQLGFPRSIQVRRLRATNWPELWSFVQARGLPNCLTPLDINVVNVLSLRPIS